MGYASLPQGGVIHEVDRGLLYEAMLNILGSTGTILPLGDSLHAPTATTFKTIGGEQATFTYSKDPTTFDTPPGIKGWIPVVTFDGVDEEADTPDFAYWTSGGAVSWGFWVKLGTAASNIFFAKWDETTGSELRTFKIYTDANGDVGLQLYDETNNGGIGRKIDTALTTDTWIFIVVTHTGGADATNIIVYKDGVAADDADIVDDAAFANPVDTATIITLGYEESTAGAKANFFDGSMAIPFFTQIELTADQVLRLYELGRRALEL